MNRALQMSSLSLKPQPALSRALTNTTNLHLESAFPVLLTVLSALHQGVCNVLKASSILHSDNARHSVLMDTSPTRKPEHVRSVQLDALGVLVVL